MPKQIISYQFSNSWQHGLCSRASLLATVRRCRPASANSEPEHSEGQSEPTWGKSGELETNSQGADQAQDQSPEPWGSGFFTAGSVQRELGPQGPVCIHLSPTCNRRGSNSGRSSSPPSPWPCYSINQSSSFSCCGSGIACRGIKLGSPPPTQSALECFS